MASRGSPRVPGAGGLGASGSGVRADGKLAWWPGGHVPPTPDLPAALAGEDCLWYLDRNGSWHPGFNCEFTFCCGTCYHRYCCRDLTLLITERQQKHCLAFRWARVPSILLSGGLPGPPLLPPTASCPSPCPPPQPQPKPRTRLGDKAGC